MMKIKTLNYKHGTSRRMEELWPWITVLECWDYGVPEPLAKLLYEQPIPKEFKQQITDIITGIRKPNYQAIKNLSVCPIKLNQVILMLSYTLGSLDLQRVPLVVDKRFMTIEDPSTMNKRIKNQRDLAYSYAQRELGLSRKSLDYHLGRLRKKIKDWPII